jgi:hypothetical protein
MATFLRFLQLLAMAVWVGGLCFFAFVLAPTAFGVLPNFHEAGLVVGASLKVFDKVELGCGAIFLLATAAKFLRAQRSRTLLGVELGLAALMVMATAYLQNGIIPPMDRDQAQVGGNINTVAPSNPARIEFEKLHERSERVAGMTLLLGIAVVFLLALEQTGHSRDA